MDFEKLWTNSSFAVENKLENLAGHIQKDIPFPQILIIYQWIAECIFFIGENRILQLLEKKLNFIFSKLALKTVKCSAKKLVERTLSQSLYKIINLQDLVTNLPSPSFPQTCELYRNWKVLGWSPAASYVERGPFFSNHPANV